MFYDLETKFQVKLENDLIFYAIIFTKLQVILKENEGEFWWKSLGLKRRDILKTACSIFLKMTAMKSIFSLKTPISQTILYLQILGFQTSFQGFQTSFQDPSSFILLEGGSSVNHIKE